MPDNQNPGISYTQYTQIEKQGEIVGKLGMLQDEVKTRFKEQDARLSRLEGSSIKQSMTVAIIVGGIVLCINFIVPILLKQGWGGLG